MISTDDLSSLFSDCKLHAAKRSTLDILPPDQPAIYAFFDAFLFNSESLSDSVDDFAVKHARVLELDRQKMPESVNLKLRGTPKGFKAKNLEKGIKAGSDKELFLNTVCMLSILSEPQYIGETKNVKTRFEDHHDSGFLFKMKRDYKRPPSEFLFFYYPCPKAFIKLGEKLLIHLISPPANIKDSLKANRK